MFSGWTRRRVDIWARDVQRGSRRTKGPFEQRHGGHCHDDERDMSGRQKNSSLLFKWFILYIFSWEKDFKNGRICKALKKINQLDCYCYQGKDYVWWMIHIVYFVLVHIIWIMIGMGVTNVAFLSFHKKYLPLIKNSILLSVAFCSQLKKTDLAPTDILTT